MSDQIINMISEAKNFLPWISFVAGAGGSLHCVGMCGGLATASCEKNRDIFRYQIGRLIGYLFLGTFAGLLGSFLNYKKLPPFISFLPGLFIGVLFIYWGIQNYRGKKAELPAPKFMTKFYTQIWMKLVYKNQNFTKAFFTGLISIALPCGLLYGIVLGTVALESLPMALTSMFFFWLGTVPSMVAAPGIVRKFLLPFKAKLPKTYALSLVAIGLVTISFRMVKLHSQIQPHPDIKTVEKLHCH